MIYWISTRNFSVKKAYIFLIPVFLLFTFSSFTNENKLNEYISTTCKLTGN